MNRDILFRGKRKDNGDNTELKYNDSKRDVENH